jgi:hypothetical protein
VYGVARFPLFDSPPKPIGQPLEPDGRELDSQSIARDGAGFLDQVAHSAQDGRGISRVLAELVNQSRQDIQFPDHSELSCRLLEATPEFPRGLRIQSEQRQKFTKPA